MKTPDRTKTRLPFRLMLRVEGAMWNAYIGTGPADQQMVGSIAMGFVTHDRRAKDAFMKLMSDGVAYHVEQIVGEKPEMEVHDAPESERAGHA